MFTFIYSKHGFCALLLYKMYSRYLGHNLLGLFHRYTEYQFPKEQTLCYSENRIADVTKIKAMRPRKSGYAIFPSKDRRKLPKEHDYRLFCVFRTNRYSVYSGSRIDGILFHQLRAETSSVSSP